MKKRHNIWLVILFFSLTITIHELGHAIALFLCGVDLVEMTLGVGPEIARFHLGNGADLILRPVPFAGHVLPVTSGPKSIEALSLWLRAGIEIAGIFANMLAVFVMTLIAKRRINPRKREFRQTVRLVANCFWLSVSGPFAVMGKMFYDLCLKPLTFLKSVKGPTGAATEFQTIEESPLVLFAVINFAVASFNLLPLNPLDAGKIMSHVINGFFGPVANHYFERGGMYLVALMIMTALVGDFVRTFKKT